MGTPTYTLIQEQILGSSTATVTFSSIPQIYEDLILEISARGDGSNNDIRMRFNSDASALYSSTTAAGSGSVTSSYRESSQTNSFVDFYGVPATAANTYNASIINIMSYSSVNAFKTSLCRSGSGNGIDMNVLLYRSTSAITSITLNMSSQNFVSSANFASGSTFRLYGLVG